MSYVDAPGKKPKHCLYEEKSERLENKDNDFSFKKFHNVRKVSTQKKMIRSFKRIAICLNGKPLDHFQASQFEKACFILINDYEDKDKYELGVGPLNDGYLIGLKLFKLGFKVFYLYNPESEEFGKYLGFFVKNTLKELTVFYTGRVTSKNTGISFAKTALVKESMSRIIESNYNGNTKIVFITDSLGSGSVFSVNVKPYKNMISISVVKKAEPETKEFKRSHGIFTFYLCKILNETPQITPKKLAERMDALLSRFSEQFKCENNDQSLGDAPLYS